MDPHFECRATVSLLRSGRTLAIAAHAAALIAAFQLHGDWLLLTSLLSWCIATYLAFRIRIDEGLFELLSEDPSNIPAVLDEFLATHSLRKAGGSRSIHDRCLGAMRLWRILVAAILIQFATLALATLLRFK